MAVRAQSKVNQPITLRFEEGVGPDRGGPPLGLWQSSIPTQPAIEGTFPKPIIAQGVAAFQRGKVRSLNLRRNDIVATVADTETHTTTLTRDTSRPPLGMRCNCTCRYGYDCKHAVAALSMLSELAAQGTEAHTDGAVPTAPAAAGNGAATNGNGVAVAPTNGAAATAPPPSARLTSELGELLDLLSPHHETIVPRRRLWVVVGFDERLGVFYARLCLDAPKLHGVSRTHGDLQQLYRTTRQANLTGEEWDRYDSALLSDATLGSMFGTPADYALARPSSEHTQRLSNNFAQLLLRLISHPRVRYDDHLGSHPETMPHVKIILSPLRLRLAGERDAGGDLQLAGQFIRPDGSTIESTAVRVIDGMPAWLFDGQTFYLHDGSFGVRIVERFKTTGELTLSSPEVPKLLERAHGLLDRDTAAKLLLLPEEMEKQTLLRLRWQGDGITADAAVEDAKSGANWPITTGEFSPLRRIDDGKKDSVPRYAYCDPAVAHLVRTKLESHGFRPWTDIYEAFHLEHPDDPLPHYDETAWRLEGTDNGYQFGTEVLPAWRSEFHLDLDETMKSLVEGPKAIHVSLSVDSSDDEKSKAKAKGKISASASGPIDWLEISVELMLDGQPLSPDDVKALWQSSGRFYRLADGRFIDLSSFALLREATGGFGNALERGGRARLTTAQMLSVYDDLAKACGDQELPAQLRELREAVRGFSGIEEIDPPDHLTKILRPYQRRGLDFLAYLGRYAFGGILADDMGLGKTLQVLSYVERERQRRGSAPNLIVCPTSVTHTWLSEAARFTPAIKVSLLTAGAGREAVYNEADKYDLLVTSYALARRDAESLNKLAFRTIVLDEAQQIKNPQAKISQVIKGIEAEQRLALTGTPIENSVLDLWSIVDFVMPGLLGNESHFRSTFETPIMRDGDVDKQQRLARRVQPFMIRRLKTQVAADLPSRTEQTIECEMTTSQKKAYRETVLRARRDILREVDERGIQRAQLSILAALTKLRQICCHPGLIGDHWREDEEASGKFLAFMELLESIVESGHRVLVFSSFTEMLGIMRETLDARKRTYSYLDGATKNRSKVLDDFRREDGPPVFLMSLKAGGVGLTVTEADYVVLYDPWWNPAVERQAIDRTHRIGQTKPVTAYRLVTLGSVEEKIQALQSRKQALADSVVSTDAAFAKSLTREDLDELFAPIGE
ncbi:MAG: SWIM zinc finger family protein [Candidatus Eremiobacteraeota bacterium]|nr:SWIM zinc finger family protein [Candidatus Eremiobacteraeota bacterium]